MKGDIAFVGFMLTADEWQALDAESRAQLIAVATRRGEQRADRRPDAPVERPRRFPDGTGKHEVLQLAEAELLEDADLIEDLDLLELEAEGDSNLEPASSKSVDDGWGDPDLDFSDLND